MNNNDITSTDYFSNRNINPASYKKYKLPVYLLDLIKDNKELSILDIGCGLGQMMKALKEKGFTNVSGIDISVEAVEACKNEGLSVTFIQDLKTYCHSSLAQKFDFIIMSHVLEHIEKKDIIDTVRLIKENLLNENGRFIVMVPNAQANTGAYWAYEDFTHSTLFTSGSIFYVLRSAGFTKIEFIDPKGISGFNPLVKLCFSFLLGLYKLNKKFWNLVTLSSYHKPSPQIYTYELKVLAQC